MRSHCRSLPLHLKPIPPLGPKEVPHGRGRTIDRMDEYKGVVSSPIFNPNMIGPMVLVIASPLQ